MRLVISGGGSGGHVYPALAAVQSLTRLCAEAGTPLDILWIGSRGGMEESLVTRAGLTIELISASGLRGKNPLAFLAGLGRLSRGYRQSRQLLTRFRPDVLFLTGGYVSVPVTLAAWRLGIPSLIYLPDAEPGLAIKFLARFVNRVAISTAATARFFKPEASVVTGYPVRADLPLAAADEQRKAAARAELELDPDQPLLLVFGGSQGARSINRAVTAHIEAYLAVCQVLHITGRLDIDWVTARRAELPAPVQQRYHVVAYLHETMVAALQAANLVISRAGASVMGEYPAVGLPAILVPLPIAGGHQALNAQYLADHQAALMLDDADLSQNLKQMALNLITNPNQLQAMAAASRSLAKPQAADHLAQVIMEEAGKTRQADATSASDSVKP